LTTISVLKSLSPLFFSLRDEMPNGGYVKENGVTLCKGDDGTSCHEKAEMVLQGIDIPGFSPDDLYTLIGSDRDRAFQESEKL
jgi:hypothetical protein